MLECMMLYSPTCHACESTKPLMRIIENQFRDYVEFVYTSVAEPDLIYRLFNNKEDYIADLHYSRFSIPIDEDEELTPEQKARYKNAGMEYSPALPTFIIRNLKTPYKYALIVGGIAPDSTRKDAEELLDELRLTFMKMMKEDYMFLRPSSMASQFPEWRFRGMFQNPFENKYK